MHLRRAILCLLPLVLPLLAQDDELPPDEVADLVERYVERGIESLRQGNYEEARLRFQKALRRDASDETAHLGIAWCHRAVGAYGKAEAQLGKLMEKSPSSRAGRLALGRLDLLQGRIAAAREKAEEVLAGSVSEGLDLVGLQARLLLAETHARRGQRGDARTVLDFFVKYYESRYDTWSEAKFSVDKLKHRPDLAWPLSEEMTAVAAALRLYVELSPLDNTYIETANELILIAQELDGENWEAWIEGVRIRRAEREGALAAARKARDIVTPKNPELADLYTEVALSLLTGFGPGEAREEADKALKINPRQTDARAVMARLMLEDNQYPEALEHIEAGLAVDPMHRDLLSLRATLDLLRGDDKAFEEGMKRVLTIDPSYGEAFHLAGMIVATRQRRYDRGVELVRRGLELDPANFQAQATLGIFLANLGRAEEARESLAQSQKLFPWSHPIRENFKTVLDYVLETMTGHRTEHFVYRFDPGEYAILSRFLPELMEACWAEMTRRYGFTPKAPVLVEVFRKADDFSVRTLGLPGIPALGACFGGLITLDSPQALPPGEFLWSSTARHEFAHVMSLQLSKGQVPRWFTEGLSVLEEKPLDTGWGMHAGFEKQLFDAYHTGSLPEIGSFDALFRTAQVAYAYHVGGLMLEFLHQRSGEEGIVRALRLYGEDRPMEEVFREAFGLELKEFDRLFREHVGKRVAAYKRVPNYAVVMRRLRANALEAPDDGENLLHLAWAHFQRGEFVDAGARFDQARRHLKGNPALAILLEAHLKRRAGRDDEARALYEAFFAAGGDDYDARMVLASYQLRAQEEDAFVASLEKALEAWPLDAESAQSPYAMLRRHYMGKGRTDEALKMLEAQARVASRSIPLRLQLAREYLVLGRTKEAIGALEEALGVTLFNREVHKALLPLYREIKETKKAVRAARCVVELKTEEDSDEQAALAWLDLAEVLFEDGQKAEAQGALAEAKRLVPRGDLERFQEVERKLGQ